MQVRNKKNVSDKRIVRDMSNILKKTSRHSLEIASQQAKLRNIRLFEQPPTRNFETFVKKVRRPSKLSRHSPKMDFRGKLFEISPGRAPDLKSARKSSIQPLWCVTKVWHIPTDLVKAGESSESSRKPQWVARLSNICPRCDI